MLPTSPRQLLPDHPPFPNTATPQRKRDDQQERDEQYELDHTAHREGFEKAEGPIGLTDMIRESLGRRIVARLLDDGLQRRADLQPVAQPGEIRLKQHFRRQGATGRGECAATQFSSPRGRLGQ